MAQKAPDYIKIKRMYINQISQNRKLEATLLSLTHGPYASMHQWYTVLKRNKSDNYIIYVAFDTRINEAVGWSMVSDVSDDWLSNGQKKIGTYVGILYRRQGIGARLVKAVKRIDKDWVFFKYNQGAKAFYADTIKKSTDYNYAWGAVK